MNRFGIEVNPHITRNLFLENKLKIIFQERYGMLLAEAMLRIGKKRNFEIPLEPINFDINSELRGCKANYCAKECRFDYIQYTVRGKRGAYYAKRIKI